MQINSAIHLTIETCALKHLSISIQKAYTQWLQRYARFLTSSHPGTRSTEQKIKAFLTHLAKTNISASTQNQAFNALLFFYREVLKPPLGPVAAHGARIKHAGQFDSGFCFKCQRARRVRSTGRFKISSFISVLPLKTYALVVLVAGQHECAIDSFGGNKSLKE
jgi:hypothetical protein